MTNLTPPCKFPIPKFNDAEIAFGAGTNHYLTESQLGDWYLHDFTPFHQAVDTLFVSGGKLDDFGLTVKSNLNSEDVYRALKALMRSWAPKHEIKVGTVAVALANWCDYTPKTN
jgi:hypothetical protein